jgi:hypothetical protein
MTGRLSRSRARDPSTSADDGTRDGAGRASETREDETYDELDEQFRPLVERLRRLEWPRPPAEVRERGLEALKRRLSERE